MIRFTSCGTLQYRISQLIAHDHPSRTLEEETAQDLCRDDDGDDGGDGGKKIVSLARDPREEMCDMIANLS